ncbi:MAG: hypothetical protein ABJL67_00855 [Sulfitobacter sp.]
MSYKPSKHPKKWERTSKVLAQNQVMLERNRKMAVAALSKAETKFATTSAWVTAAQPAIKDMRNMPAAYQDLRKEMDRTGDLYAKHVVELISLEEQIEDETDEKRRKKLIAQHRTADLSANAMNASFNMMKDSVNALSKHYEKTAKLLV